MFASLGHTSDVAYVTHSRKVGSMLAHRLRRWSNIEPTLRECPHIVFGGSVVDASSVEEMWALTIGEINHYLG